MTMLVTGATGFLGRRLCETLRQAGHPVRATLRPKSRSAGRAAALEAMGVETVTVDLADATGMAAAFEGVDTVFHLAWEANRLSAARGPVAGGAGQGMDAPAKANVAAMQTMTTCAQAAAIRRFVFTSTVSVYGPNADWGPRPRRESDLRPDMPRHRNPYFRYYAGAKVQAEEMLVAAGPALDYVILRPSIVYGPGAPFAAQFIESAVSGGRGPTMGGDAGAYPIQWVHRDDVVRALILAAQTDSAAHQVMTIAGATAMHSDTVAAEVRRLMGVGPTGGPKAVLDWNPRVPLYGLARAEQVLGFHSQVDWRTGLADMVTAHRDAASVAV